MDPRGQFLARYATQMLQFKPGRDVAMLNALLHTIIEEGLTDRQYIQAHTEDFEKLREHIRDYSPEKMARDLRHRRRDLARGRAHLRPRRARRSSSGAWASRSTPTAPTTRAA